MEPPLTTKVTSLQLHEKIMKILMLGTMLDNPKEYEDERFKSPKVARYKVRVVVGVQNSTERREADISCVVPGELGEFVCEKYKQGDEVTLLGQYIVGNIATDNLQNLEENDFIILEQQFTHNRDGLEFEPKGVPNLNDYLVNGTSEEETISYDNLTYEDENDVDVLPF